MLAESLPSNALQTFAGKLNFLMDKAGYAVRGRPSIVAEHTMVSRVAALNWLKGTSTPSEESLASLKPLVKHLLERIEDVSVEPQKVIFWLGRQGAKSPFERERTVQKAYDPAFVLKVWAAIIDTAESLAVPIESISPERFQKMADTILDVCYENRNISNSFIKNLFELALAP